MKINTDATWWGRVCVGLLITISSLLLHISIGLSPHEALYETARLFLLDANTSLGANAEPAVIIGLWLLRIGAPVVTSAALIQFLAAANVFGLVPFWWKGHVVVCGAGRLGSEIARRLVANRQRVAVIDSNAANENLALLRREGVRIVIGDAREESVLVEAQVHKSSYFVGVTPDDILNLNAGRRAKRLGTESCQSLSHFYDLRVAEELMASSESLQTDLFNVYQAAARSIAQRASATICEQDLVIIVGYGRFGRSLLEAFGNNLRGSTRFIVIDRDRNKESGVGPKANFVCGDILCEDVWSYPELARFNDEQRHIFICTDNDMRNLYCAVKLRRESRAEVIYVRLFKEVELLNAPPKDESVARIEGVVIWSEMLGGLPDEFSRMLTVPD